MLVSDLTLHYYRFYVKALSKPITSKCVCLPVPALQQTVPPGGVAVCPLSTVEYTCMGQNELNWKDSDSAIGAAYIISSEVNATGMAGVFHTVLTNISGTTLTSTATINSVSLTDDGRSITCREISNGAFTDFTRTILVQGKVNDGSIIKCTTKGIVL